MDFIKKLQSADQSVKRRWLIGASALMLVLVIFFWLKYFNTLVQSPAAVSNNPAEQGFGFWPAIKIGARVFYDGLTNTLGRWLKLLNSPKNYIIQP